MKGKPVMIQGTGSDVGKTVLTAAFCRIFADKGYKTAPFKSQNMALNSYVTPEGKEISRAQALQAEAAKIPPEIDMNPVLLKPNTDNNSQVVLKGKPYKDMTASQYFADKKEIFKIIKASYQRLINNYEIVVIEGGGSPAEINLREKDMVNMAVAKMADSPVILVANIEKGGVFADIVGTLDLLQPEEEERIKGIIINKFRGDPERFSAGVEFIENYTDKPVLGVIPYVEQLQLPEEDSLNKKNTAGNKNSEIEIAVIDLPHISNFTDYDYLREEKSTELNYIKNPENLKNPDLIIIPGSKNPVDDLQILYKQQIVGKIKKLHKNGVMIAGICGGYQMLGEVIKDFTGNNEKSIKGMGLLEVETELSSGKMTSQVKAKIISNISFFNEIKDEFIEGYEIHQGKTLRKKDIKPVFEIERKNNNKKVKDGAVKKSEDKGLIWGSYLHGLFANQKFRRKLINYLRRKKGLAPLSGKNNKIQQNRDKNYSKFAGIVKKNLKMDKLKKIVWDGGQ